MVTSTQQGLVTARTFTVNDLAETEMFSDSAPGPGFIVTSEASIALGAVVDVVLALCPCPVGLDVMPRADLASSIQRVVVLRPESNHPLMWLCSIRASPPSTTRKATSPIMNLSRRGTPRWTARTCPVSTTGTRPVSSAGSRPVSVTDVGRRVSMTPVAVASGTPVASPGHTEPCPPAGECPPAGAEEIDTTGTTAVSPLVVRIGPADGHCSTAART